MLECLLPLSSPEVDGSWKPGTAYKYTIVYTGQGEVPYSITPSIVPWNKQSAPDRFQGTYLSVLTTNMVVKKGNTAIIQYSSDALSVTAKLNTGVDLVKTGTSFTIPNTLSEGSYSIVVLADRMSCRINVKVIPASGYADLLYFKSDGTLDVGKWLTDVKTQNDLAFFKFGSVIGFRHNNDDWKADMSQVAFNPSSLTIGLGSTYNINAYNSLEGNFVNIPPSIPGWVYNDYLNYYYATDKANYTVSGSNYHTIENVRKGKGDPCKLAGLTLAQIKSGVINNFKWKMPTNDDNVAFIGAKSNDPIYTGGWPIVTSPGYYFPNPKNINLTGEFLPVAGFRYEDGKSSSLTDKLGYFWSNTSALDGNYGIDFSFNATTVFPQGESQCSSGLPIRCVPL